MPVRSSFVRGVPSRAVLACMPGDDPDPAGRARALAAERARTPWTHAQIAGVGMPARIQREDWPAASWIRACLGNNLRFQLNTRICRMMGVPLEGRPRSVADYAAAFQTLPAPDALVRARDDTTFGWFRLAGVNPTVLERYRPEGDHGIHADPRWASDHPDFAGESLAALGEAGRLYVTDYGCLARGRDLPGDGLKPRIAPVALLGVCRDGRLLPLAIQPERGSGRTPLTPRDGWAWAMARTAVDCADINHQQPMVHGFAHLLCGTVATAARRQLSHRHPVSRLLAPHTEGTVYINNMAVQGLLSFGSLVDDVMTGPMPAIRDILAANLLDHPILDRCLPRDLARRGVDDARALPSYPYREDASDLWHAIAEWVADYLDVYYADDAAVATDAEILAWAHDLGAEDGGHLRGVTPEGGLRTRAALAELLTLVVFNATVQHAAVNFSLGPIMTYTPAAPMSVWRSVPEPSPAVTEQDWLEMLPPLERAYQQVELGYRLYATFHTRLGEYRPGAFSDPRLDAPLGLFQARLAQIERRIHARNRGRHARYDYLLPSRIPQSVNI
jgi:arachidonate 15-lipoxygenase